jgi:hypothetical protein
MVALKDNPWRRLSPRSVHTLNHRHIAHKNTITLINNNRNILNTRRDEKRFPFVDKCDFQSGSTFIKSKPTLVLEGFLGTQDAIKFSTGRITQIIFANKKIIL